MATNDQYRVTKNTSSRKNIRSPATYTDEQVQTIKAGHEFVLDLTQKNHKNETARMEEAHAEEMEALESRFAGEKDEILSKRQAEIDQPTEEAERQFKDECKRLRFLIGSSEKEKGKLQSSLEKETQMLENLQVEANRKEEAHERKIESLKREHNRDCSKLQENLKVGPNSWVEFSVLQTTSGKRQKFVKRLYSTFEDAMAEYCKKAKRDYNQLSTTHNDKPISSGKATLHDLGFKDGDVVKVTNIGTKH